MTPKRKTSSLNLVKKRARALGFSSFGVVDLETFGAQYGNWLGEFIDKNHHGTMSWMDDTRERRSHPQNMWDGARSAIVLGFNYGPDSDPLLTLGQTDKATISVYARGRDYHAMIKGKLKELAALIARDAGGDVKVFVDTAPLMEKPLAGLAGLGWQGKHTNLVSREFGSWLFLGVILSSEILPANEPETDHCGNCQDCLDICPTDAFTAAYKLDARRCISYLTIEHKGPVDIELRAKLGNRIYGCDDCLAVCPWNKFAQSASEAKLQARDDLRAPDLATLAALTQAEFKTHFSGSPIKRIGWARFMRNVMYAIGNSERAELKHVAQNYCNAQDDVLRDAAQWAAGQLS